MSQQRKPGATVNLRRHQQACSVCAPATRRDRGGIHRLALSDSHCGGIHRASVYLRALGLLQKRQRDVRAALERIIENAGEVDVTASGVVAAVQA